MTGRPREQLSPEQTLAIERAKNTARQQRFRDKRKKDKESGLVVAREKSRARSQNYRDRQRVEVIPEGSLVTDRDARDDVTRNAEPESLRDASRRLTSELSRSWPQVLLDSFQWPTFVELHLKRLKRGNVGDGFRTDHGFDLQTLIDKMRRGNEGALETIIREHPELGQHLKVPDPPLSRSEPSSLSRRHAATSGLGVGDIRSISSPPPQPGQRQSRYGVTAGDERKGAEASALAEPVTGVTTLLGRDNNVTRRYAVRDNERAEFGGPPGSYEAKAQAVEMGVLLRRVEKLESLATEAIRCLYWAQQRTSDAVDAQTGLMATDLAVRTRDVLDRAGRLVGLPTVQDEAPAEVEDNEAEFEEPAGDARPPSSPPELKLVVSGGEIVQPPGESVQRASGTVPVWSKRSEYEIREEEGPPPLHVTNPRAQAFMYKAFSLTRQAPFLWRDYSDEEVEMLEEVYRQACTVVSGDEAHGFALYTKWLHQYCRQPDRRRSGPDKQTMEEWFAQMVRDCTPAGFLKQMATYTERAAPKPWLTPERMLEELIHDRTQQYIQFGIRKS
jgi:hypothetical protein